MFELAQFPLPYTMDALVPYISQETIETHYGKHVAGYIDNLNNLIENTPYQKVSLEEIIQQSAGKPEEQKIFNNAAQVYNHDFFFHGMCKKCSAQIPDEIIAQFGSKENFNKRPDLIVIDGGFGQLHSVKEIFDEFEVDIPLISLAEKNAEQTSSNAMAIIVIPSVKPKFAQIKLRGYSIINF